MAEINIPKMIKRILDSPENKRTAKLMDLKDVYVFYDFIEETEGLTGLEPYILEAAERMGAEDFLEEYGSYLKNAMLFMELEKAKKDQRLDMILEAYEASENQEYMFYELADINEEAEINIMNALFTAAVMKNDVDFVLDYKDEMNRLERFLEMEITGEMKDALS